MPNPTKGPQGLFERSTKRAASARYGHNAQD